MVNYEYAKIYRLIDNTNGNVYIGSTCEPTLARRLVVHRSDYKCWLKGTKDYTSAFEIMKNNDYTIDLIEHVKCKSKDQLKSRLRYYLENNECINIRKRVIVSYAEEREKEREYRERNRTAILEKKKAYRDANKDKLNAYSKKYREEHKL